MHFELLVTVSCGVQVQKHSTGNVLMSLAETAPSLIKSAYQHALECTPTPSNGLPTAYTATRSFNFSFSDALKLFERTDERSISVS